MSDFGMHEFAADFLEEADQHVHSITDQLLALEQGATLSKDTVDVLFRSFHTLKGLCGMVGLKSATDVSHHAESLLARVRRHEADLSGDIMDALLMAIRSIQESVDTIRHPDMPAPQVGDILAHIGALLGGGVRVPLAATRDTEEVVVRMARALTAEDKAELNRRLAEGASLSLCTFTPSAEKAEHSITVTTIRQDLSAHAHMVKAIPLPQGSTVLFAFLLVSAHPLDAGDFPSLGWCPVTAADLALSHEPEGDGPRLTRSVSSVRVDIPRLDELMRLVGELVTSRHRLDAYQSEQKSDDRLEELVSRMGRQVKDLRQAVTRLRLVPLSEVFGRMPLAVRDLARSLNIQVALALEGEATQVDKALVERLLDPLLHLVRNALSHGLEAAAARTAAGKSPTGTLLLRADTSGDSLTIRVHDDGRGLDRDAILRRARQLGWWTSPDEPGLPELLNIMCRPGFSTRTHSDLGSGRGVGLDVVMQSVRSMGGSMTVDSVPGQSTTFLLKLPLSLAIVDALLVEVGSEVYALPRADVETTVHIESSSVSAVAGGELMPFREGAVPLFHLARLFDTARAAHNGDFYGIISGEAGQLCAFGVDRLVGMQEVVVRTITDPLIARPGIAGATELGSGRLALILNLPELIRYAHSGQRSPA